MQREGQGWWAAYWSEKASQMSLIIDGYNLLNATTIAGDSRADHRRQFAGTDWLPGVNALAE